MSMLITEVLSWESVHFESFVHFSGKILSKCTDFGFMNDWVVGTFSYFGAIELSNWY